MTVEETKAFVFENAEAARIGTDFMLSRSQLASVIELAFAAGDAQGTAQGMQTRKEIVEAAIASEPAAEPVAAARHGESPAATGE